MRVRKIKFCGAKGTELPGVIWAPEGEVKAILQVAHGMTEHMGRYGLLAEALTAGGIAVAGFDLRGHGENPGDMKCASFGQHGWEDSLEDMHLFYVYLEREFSGVPHGMLGFSLGSFLLREYLNRYEDPVAAAVIMGTGQQPGAVLSVMMAIIKNEIHKVGYDQTTPLVKKLSFETYNQKFAPVRTAMDWLCADEAELDAYSADPLCRESISAGLFWQLLSAMKRTGQKDAYDKWERSMPVLLLSGQEDRVGDGGKGVRSVEKAMAKAKLQDVTVRLFAGARHDLLHEEASGCAGQARELLAEWFLKNIAK